MPFSLLCLLGDAKWKAVVRDCVAEGALTHAWVNSPDEARAAFRDQHFDVVLADLRSATDPGFNLLDFIRRQPRPTAVAVVAGEEIADGFHPLYLHGVGVILRRSAPPSAPALRRVFESLFDPMQSVGLERHIPQGAAIDGGSIRTLADRNRFIEQASHVLSQRAARFPSVFDLRLVFEEIANNAILHAFRTSDGEKKYSRLSDLRQLADDEHVAVQFSVGPQWTGLSVRDNQGAFQVKEVLGKLYRQVSLQGLTDESGRGLFLSWSLADVLIACVVPGQITEVTALFHSPSPASEKTLCMYEPLAPSREAGRAET